MKPARVLVVDDEQILRSTLEAHLTEMGHDVRSVESATAALNSISSFGPDIVLSDVMMPGMSGLELLAHLRNLAPDIDVVLFTGHGDAQGAIDAMQLGASEYLTKPLCLDETDGVIHQCMLRRDRERKCPTPPTPVPDPEPAFGLVGRHPAMVRVYKDIGSMARAGSGSVLIRGETGTGKELVARAIHHTSGRTGPFVAVNCAAVPEALLESELFGHVRGAFTGATMDRRGRFEAAAGGTLFLDEIGDTTQAFQAKVLRVLQDREFYPVGSDQARVSHAAVIAATHRPLSEMVEEGTFREDLFYRLQGLEIQVPPLRERRSDIPLLVRHIAARASKEAGLPAPVIPPQVIDELTRREWCGNVRELENVLRRAVVMSRGSALSLRDIGVEPAGRQEAQDSTASNRSAATLSEVRSSVERRHVQHVLTEVDGNKSWAARILGVSRPTLNRLIQEHHLSIPQ